MRLRLLGILVLALVGPIASAAPAHARGTVLPCVDSNQVGFVFKHRPARCLQYVHNLAIHANEIHAVDLRWRGWGARKARGRGRLTFCSTGACTSRPAHLTAYRLKRACGRRAYTRLLVRLPASGNLPRVSLRLRPRVCGGRLSQPHL